MKKKKGFTLLEMVIVIGIIALLLAIAVPRFQKTNHAAEITAHNGNVKMIKNAAILYLNDHPQAARLSMGDLKDYFDGEEPKPARFLKEKTFSIQYDTNTGDIKVTPGEQKAKE